MSDSTKLPQSVQTSWRGFLETYEPLRPDLYRYCRHLTRSPWDAEDLVQDTLARAFVTLGQLGDSPPNPRAWLFRVASNLWIDQLRRRRREQPSPTGYLAEQAISGTSEDPQQAREAAGTLLGQLTPQERAALVLKDVFALSLEETAEALSTSVGAIKAALHRARGRLVEAPSVEATTPAPAVLDAFCRAFNAGDLERVAALLLDSAAVEVVGATQQYGREAAKSKVLWGMLFGVNSPGARGIVENFMPGVSTQQPPRVEARLHRGAWVLLHWYGHADGDAVRALTRLDVDEDQVTQLHNYFYTPDLIVEVCRELGVPARPNGYRWWLCAA
jgi:RNA polymerase sigma-70 factor (ECF subfamily)